MLSIIVAIADNGAIGANNQLIWHISEDLKYFKRVTQGHAVIMGRKTWESVGRPLPNRRNMVISRSVTSLKGAEVYKSLEEAISAAASGMNAAGEKETEVFIIGGGEIYRQAMPLADRLYLTFVHTTIENADTFFPEVDHTQWQELSRESFERNPVCVKGS